MRKEGANCGLSKVEKRRAIAPTFCRSHQSLSLLHVLDIVSRIGLLTVRVLADEYNTFPGIHDRSLSVGMTLVDCLAKLSCPSVSHVRDPAGFGPPA